ncbi:unnamed protein product, partial [Didymodactylos carnosus]
APSAGKLLHFTIEDGGLIEAGQVYAEIEVMKMVMELRCAATGHLQYIKRPGAVLESGCIMARIILDDSSQTQKLQLYEGKFTDTPINRLKGIKLNQILQLVKISLENILTGYTYPEPYFHERLKENVDTLFNTLCDPSLPLLELEEILATISARIPLQVDQQIKSLMKNYMTNLTSILIQFPSQQIANVIETYAEKLKHREERDMFFTTIHPIIGLVQRYRNGIKGHTKLIITNLIENYLNIETLFQNEQYDNCLTLLRENHKTDMHRVVELVFSHANYQSKNALIVMLIDVLFARDSTLTDEIKKLMHELTLLDNQKSIKVALKARHILIAFQKPPFELRYNHMESIFLTAIDMYGHKLCEENLRKLILSETSIFEVLHSFYFHSTIQVRQAALEVYVRRSYISYDLISIQHDYLSNGICTIQFSVHLPQNHPNRSFDELVDRFSSTVIADSTLTPLPRSFSRQISVDSASMDEAMNVIYIFIKDDTNFQQRFKLENIFLDFIQSKEICDLKNVRRVTFYLGAKFQEDKIYRNLEPALAYQLEIYRLRLFDLEFIPTSNYKMHLYLGKGKVHNKQHQQDENDHRFFIRSIIRHSDIFAKEASFEYLQNEAERTLLEAMDVLELAFSHPLARKTDCNHIFICFVPTVCADPVKLEESIRSIVLRYGARLLRLRVLQAELKMIIRITPDSEQIPFRVFVSNDNGYYLEISLYREVRNSETGQSVYQSYRAGKTGPLDGKYLHDPYVTKDHLQHKRFTAQSNGTTYVYDFPEMFRQALSHIWRLHMEKNNAKKTLPGDLFEYEELILDNSASNSLNDLSFSLSPVGAINAIATTPSRSLINSPKINDKIDTSSIPFSSDLLKKCGLQALRRHPTENDCGMIAWRMKLKTPEYPNGRIIIVIANDLTYKIGSFGIEEDLLFQRSSQLARLQKIPRIYIAANSGARIGLAEELKTLYRIAWNDVHDIEKGIKYLYVSKEDYERIENPNYVKTEVINDENEVRYKILDIIGKENGLGVENLRGSGMIAGETSEAYNTIPTISLVTCRAVGIGAYLVRLGSRVIQVKDSHIILTGFSALNKVLGQEIYNNNNQLGGTQIMFNNGVTHDVVKDDFDGCLLILKWLSYMPKTMLHSSPVLTVNDPIDRPIDFIPTSMPYDPRHMIQGHQFFHANNEPVVDAPSSSEAVSQPNISNLPSIAQQTFSSLTTTTIFQTGFFDRDSFVEIMKGWAKTVITGRARLGGISIGVIAVETRTVELEQPADPAHFDSDAYTIQQAGQVWFPDSAYKTAQAIRDFKRENLPLMIFANWRGFSAGSKDMYDQVIKFGAYIVDALREYEQPVFVYIPPYGELRGGAWVVVDPTINIRFMEMYADRLSRGGVLEPEGTVEIKYRTKDLVRTMHRLDSICRELQMNINRQSAVAKRRASIVQTSIIYSPSPSLPPTTSTTDSVKDELQRQLSEREKLLTPAYKQAAVIFSDLHDTPGRMLEKGVIRGILDWQTSREFFYWRLKRRLKEEAIIKHVLNADSTTDYQAAFRKLQQWFMEDKNDTSQWNSDKIVVEWLENQLSETDSRLTDRIRNIEKQDATNKIKDLLIRYPDILPDIVQNTTDDQRLEIQHLLNNINSVN